MGREGGRREWEWEGGEGGKMERARQKGRWEVEKEGVREGK